MSEQARSAGEAGTSTSLIVGFVLVALIALAGTFVLDMYRRDGRAAATAINNSLRNAEQSLADLGTAEAAYIAAGQNSESANTWMNRATASAVQLEAAVANLHSTSASPEATAHYAAATPLVATITANDQKARGLVESGQALVATDLVLIEGANTVGQLRAELDAARTAEMARFEAMATQWGWIGLGGTGAVMLIGLLLLMAAARRRGAASSVGLGLQTGPERTSAPDQPGTPAPEHLSTRAPGGDALFAPSADLSGAADLCVDLGLVQNSGQLAALMARAATVLDAKGLVLWVSEAGGGVLRPTMAHGYSDRVLQRMGTLLADGDNVTSLAFRSRQPQVVRGSIDGQGALAVPLMTGAGCVGVLAAVVQGAKPGDARFAIARIIAAQLSTLVAPAVSAEAPQSAAQS
jgi:hypothetical protein